MPFSSRLRRLLSSPSRDARSVASATPFKKPFSSGLDGERFARYYAEAEQDKRLRLKQRIYNVWHFYFGPVAIGMLPGSLVAERYFGGAADVMWWVLVVYGTALLVAPGLMLYRRKHHGHRRFQHFYTGALERCIAEEQGRA